jgi:hypothetical protein
MSKKSEKTIKNNTQRHKNVTEHCSVPNNHQHLIIPLNSQHYDKELHFISTLVHIDVSSHTF